MKKKSFLSMLMAVLVMLSVALSFVACDDDDDDDSNGPTSTADVTIADGETISGTISNTTEIAEGATVTLSGVVTVADGATLKINSGVTVEADVTLDSVSMLIVAQGGTIDAQGTADAPIVFTRNEISNTWGGIVINGKAQTNKGAVDNGEGNSGAYGADNGDNNDDNSGTLKYVVIRFAGYNFTDEDQLNGLCLQGVGSGTTVEYVQTHRGADDGVEMFGGRVNLKYFVASGNEDDQIDCTDGWIGSVDHAVAISLNEDGNDRGIEHDSNKKNNAATPQTQVAYNNLTLIVGADGAEGARIRRGAQVTFEDSYFCALDTANGEKIIDVRDKLSTAELTDCVFQGAIDGGLNAGITQDDVDDGYTTADNAATIEDNISTTNVTEGTDIDAEKFASYAALSAISLDDLVTSTGAVTDASNNWMEGWVTFPTDK